MLFFRSKLLKGFLSFICSFYLAILLQSYYNLSYPYFIFTGLIFFVICLYAFRYFLNKHNDRLFNKNVAFISIGIAAFIMLAFDKSVNPAIEADGYTVIKVTALGEKSDSSKASEVWINQIKNDLIDLDLNNLPLSKGWEIKDNYLVSYRAQPATLTIKIENPVHPTLFFHMHSWSGKVKIEEGNKTLIEDLYKDNAAGFYKYTSNVVISNKGKVSITKVLLTGIAFLALFIFSYLCLLLAKSRKNFILLSIPLYFIVYSLPGYLHPAPVIKFFLLAVSIAAFFIMQKCGANEFINTYIKPNKTTFCGIVIYSGFACVGFQLFLSNFPVNNIIPKIAYFLLFNSWLALVAISYLYVTYLVKTKITSTNTVSNTEKRYRSISLFSIFFFILLAIWSIYFIAFFPANMTSDSFEQWGEAIGKFPLHNLHPIFHTLFIRLSLSVSYTPAILSVLQILFMAAVCSSFLLFLYKIGIPRKWLIVFAILVGIAPANGITVVTIWKDIPYACSVLWITLVLAELISKKYIFNYKITLIALSVSLILVAMLRHNGLLTVLIIAAAITWMAIKNRQKTLLIPVVVSLCFVFGFKIITPLTKKVIPVPEGLKWTPAIHGIASVMYYKGELTKETQQEMEKILPAQDWLKLYSPYSCDNYIFRSKPTFLSDLAKLPADKAVKMYLTTFVDNPYLIIRDRLSGTDLVWNVSQPNEAFNGRFASTIGDNTFGLKQNNSSLKENIIQFLNLSVEKADTLFWRAGLYNILLLFLIILIKHRKRNIFIFLPIIGNSLSLMMAMCHQDFRYVYSIPLTFGFIWLLTVSDAISFPDLK